MPQADILTYFFLVESFLLVFITVYLFTILYCFLNFFNGIKFFFIMQVLTPINRLKVISI